MTEANLALRPDPGRDPRAATIRQGYLGSTDMPMVNEWDAEQAFRLGYLANVIAYRCIQLRANAVASIPLVAGRKLGDAKTINEKAPIAKLLGPPPGGPAPRLSASKLIRWTMAQEIITGRRAWEIETNAAGVPIAFWPLPTASLEAIPSKGGTEWFKSFTFGRGAQRVTFKPEDVFFGWDPAGTDFRQAESVLQSARYDLSLVTMADRYGLSFLKNNAVPATVVTTTSFPDDATKRAFERQWSSEFQGTDNAGRTAFNYVGGDGDGPVSESIDVKVLGLSAKDSRLIEQRKAAMQETAIALGTPWSKLDASGRTFDNAEVEDRSWYEETIHPDLQDLQDDINMQLAPRLGGDVIWFDLRGVRAFQRRLIPIDQVPILVEKRIITLNEGRDAMDLDGLDGGDDLRPEPEAPAELPAAPPQLALPPGDIPNVVNDDGTARTLPVIENRAADPEAIEQRRAKVWRTADAVARGLESRWERAWRKLFARQLDATLVRVTGKRGRQMLERRDSNDPIDPAEPAPQIDPAAVFDPAFWTEQTADMVESLYEDVASAGLTRISTAYGIDFDLSAPWVADFIATRTKQLSGQITDTTYEAIRLQLSEGVSKGEPIDGIAKRIRGMFEETYKDRAVTIARTEVIGAYNGAASLGASQLPADVVGGQEWIATRDGRTRETHAAVDGQIIPIGVPFNVGGTELAYPGDPAGGASNTVNCRCTVGFLSPEEMADQAGRRRLQLEHRTAHALVALVDADTDFIKWRRAAEEVAA